VTARLDARYVPVGRSTVQVTDDGDPLGTFPVAVTLDARRASRFGLGTWTDEGNGQVYVSAPVRMYSPAAGRYVPQSAAPVRVQELVAGRWVTVATLVTNRYGIAGGYVTTGGGVFRMRVQRPQGAKRRKAASPPGSGETRRPSLSTAPTVVGAGRLPGSGRCGRITSREQDVGGRLSRLATSQ
jgi:hypothetical protein